MVVAGGWGHEGRLSSVERMTRSETGVWSSWTAIGRLPSGRYLFGMTTVGNGIVAVGGITTVSEDSVLMSVDGETWEETEYTLGVGRYGFTMISTENICQH